jgi:Holliday junction resolvase RusA-like endonuclease
MPAYRFDVVPVAAPRMNQADRWKRRPCVVRYFEYRDQVRNQAQVMGVTLSETFSVQFYLPMPRSWSKRKRQDYDGKPHQVKPDADNLLKAWMDCFGEDCVVWSVSASKFWSASPAVVLIAPAPSLDDLAQTEV